MSVVREVGVDLVGSAVCGVTYCVGNKLIGGGDIGLDKTTGMRFATSAGSHLLADVTNGQVSRRLAKMSPTLAQYERLIIQPVSAGIWHVILDYFLQNDSYQSKTYKFLLQVGSSAVSNYGTAPLRAALGM